MAKHDDDSGLIHIGFIEALVLLFVGLRLTGYIDWPWLWVVSPLWITLLVCAVLAGLALLIDWLLSVIHGDECDENESS